MMMKLIDPQRANGFENWIGSGMVSVVIVFSTKCEDLNDG
jgi:hypothetical protein